MFCFLPMSDISLARFVGFNEDGYLYPIWGRCYMSTSMYVCVCERVIPYVGIHS